MHSFPEIFRGHEKFALTVFLDGVKKMSENENGVMRKGYFHLF